MEWMDFFFVNGWIEFVWYNPNLNKFLYGFLQSIYYNQNPYQSKSSILTLLILGNE